MKNNYLSDIVGHHLATAALLANMSAFGATEFQVSNVQREILFLDKNGDTLASLTPEELEQLTCLNATQFGQWIFCERLLNNYHWHLPKSDREIITWERSHAGITFTMRDTQEHLRPTYQELSDCVKIAHQNAQKQTS